MSPLSPISSTSPALVALAPAVPTLRGALDDYAKVFLRSQPILARDKARAVLNALQKASSEQIRQALVGLPASVLNDLVGLISDVEGGISLVGDVASDPERASFYRALSQALPGPRLAEIYKALSVKARGRPGSEASLSLLAQAVALNAPFATKKGYIHAMVGLFPAEATWRAVLKSSPHRTPPTFYEHPIALGVVPVLQSLTTPSDISQAYGQIPDATLYVIYASAAGVHTPYGQSLISGGLPSVVSLPKVSSIARVAGGEARSLRLNIESRVAALKKEQAALAEEQKTLVGDKKNLAARRNTLSALHTAMKEQQPLLQAKKDLSTLRIENITLEKETMRLNRDMQECLKNLENIEKNALGNTVHIKAIFFEVEKNVSTIDNIFSLLKQSSNNSKKLVEEFASLRQAAQDLLSNIQSLESKVPQNSPSTKSLEGFLTRLPRPSQVHTRNATQFLKNLEKQWQSIKSLYGMESLPSFFETASIEEKIILSFDKLNPKIKLSYWGNVSRFIFTEERSRSVAHYVQDLAKTDITYPLKVNGGIRPSLTERVKEFNNVWQDLNNTKAGLASNAAKMAMAKKKIEYFSSAVKSVSDDISKLNASLRNIDQGLAFIQKRLAVIPDALAALNKQLAQLARWAGPAAVWGLRTVGVVANISILLHFFGQKTVFLKPDALIVLLKNAATAKTIDPSVKVRLRQIVQSLHQQFSQNAYNKFSLPQQKQFLRELERFQNALL